MWELILSEHPTDMLALKLAHDCYFYTGKSKRIRDSIAAVLPSWNESIPLYGFLMGMWSFGLVETNLFDQAERVARRVSEKELSTIYE